jgi:imidazolonepropionase
MTQSILITNIGNLVQAEKTPSLKRSGHEMGFLPTLTDAFLFIENGIIADFGKMSDLTPEIFENTDYLSEINAEGKSVFPSFCDSHTHLVYAGSREIEYADKIKGLSYEEIAVRGGGILNSSKLLNSVSEDELYEQSLERIHEIIAQGTGAVEIKSGYGLTLNGELKMLRVIKRLKETTPLTIKSTFLAAHAVPPEFKGQQAEYVEYVIREILPQVVSEKLADFIDVFCDKGFFTVAETAKILEAGQKFGLIPKIHANELALSGGVQIAVKYDALSADHLEYIEQPEIEDFLKSRTMPTILPGAAFFLNLPFSPVRKMIDAGLPVAVASDFNPGSSPSGNMKLMVSLAMINYKMTAQEAINAGTLNSAYAMGVSDILGSISPGKIANVFITKKIPTVEFFPYAYGSDLAETVILNGEIL